MEGALYRHEMVEAGIDAAIGAWEGLGLNMLEAYQAAKSLQLACAQQMALNAADTEAFRAALEKAWKPEGGAQ